MSKKNPQQYIWPDLVVSIENGLVTFENGKSYTYNPEYLKTLITTKASDHNELEEKRLEIVLEKLAHLLTHDLFLCNKEEEKRKKMAAIVSEVIKVATEVQLPELSFKALYERFINTYLSDIKKVATSISDTFHLFRDQALAKLFNVEFGDQATIEDYRKILYPPNSSSNGKHSEPDGEA